MWRVDSYYRTLWLLLELDCPRCSAVVLQCCSSRPYTRYAASQLLAAYRAASQLLAAYQVYGLLLQHYSAAARTIQ